jgi:hypothetical protein
MANTETLQFSEYLLHFFVAHLLDSSAAVGGNQTQLFRIGFEKFGNEWAAAGFEIFEDFDFGGEAVRSVCTSKFLMNSAIVTDANDRALSIFGFEHMCGSIG